MLIGNGADTGQCRPSRRAPLNGDDDLSGLSAGTWSVAEDQHTRQFFEPRYQYLQGSVANFSISYRSYIYSSTAPPASQSPRAAA